MNIPAAQGRFLDRRANALAVLAFIVVLGLVLRSWELSAVPLWFDEAFSARMVELPLGDIVPSVARDNHPPLYFLVLKLWTSLFGLSVVALRGLSVALGGLTIVGMYLFTVAIVRGSQPRPDGQEESLSRARAAGLVVAALVALSVFQIRCSWDARMYTLGTALAAFSSWALIRALHESRPGPWLLYGVLALLFLYTHYYALFSVAAQGLYAAGYLLVQTRCNLRHRSWRPALLAAAVIVVGFAPWVPVLSQQRGQVHDQFWIPRVGPATLRQAAYQMFVRPEYPPAAIGRPDGVPLLPTTFLCAVGLIILLWQPNAANTYMACAGLVPVALSYWLSTVDTPIFFVRYLVFAHLFLLAGLGMVLLATSFRWRRRLAVALMLAVFINLYGRYQRCLDTTNANGDWAAAAWLAEQRAAGEPVVVRPPWLYFNVRYYLDRPPDCFVEAQTVKHHDGGALVTPGEMVALDRLAAPRVWVVDLIHGNDPGSMDVPPGWRLVSMQSFPERLRSSARVVVLEFVTTPSERDSRPPPPPLVELPSLASSP